RHTRSKRDWSSDVCSSDLVTGGADFPVPYLFNVPNQRKQHTTIINNIGSARSMRAPRQPQACLLTMCALEDLAAKLGMDPLDLEIGRASCRERVWVSWCVA